MRVKTKQRIGILSDVIAAIGLIAVFAVILTGSSKNLSRINPAKAALASITTNAASNITDISADLNSTLNSSDSDVTALGFEWGTTVSYGNTINVPHTSSIFASTDANPDAITVDSSGNIYTANYNADNVTKITPGGVSSILGTTSSGPGSIVVDSSGTVYTANFNSNNVTKITAGGISTTLGTTGSGPTGISIDSIGNIYTANYYDNNVTKITPGGVSSILGTTSNGPKKIVVDSSDNIYTANADSNNVTKITPGGVSSILGTTGNRPVGIAIDSVGNIYTANLDSNDVSKITPLGASSIFGTTDSNPQDITIDSTDNVYTANYVSANVTKITPLGASSTLGSTGFYPTGITVDSAKNVYTANSGSNNVTKISQVFTVGPYSTSLSGLTCNTTYHYRAFATNSDGTSYGADESFTTTACPVSMVIQTLGTDLVGENSASLVGAIVSSDTPIGSRGFEYGTSVAYGSSVYDPTPVGYLSTGQYSLPVGPLNCNTTYHFRAVATNDTGTFYGDDLTFATKSCTPDMAINTDPASAVTDTATNLNGEILSTKSTITARGFQWGTTTTYTNTVTDSSPNIKAYSFLSKFGTLGSGEGQFNGNADVTVDKFGNIFVTDVYNDRVQKFDNNGNFILQFGSLGNLPGQFNNVLAVRTDSNGDVFVVDRLNYRVQKFDNNGNYISEFGSFGSGNGQFNYMQGISIDHNDDLYVVDSTNNNVQKFDNAGNYILTIGGGPYGTGDGQFGGPLYSAVDSANNVYVADSGNNRIQKFDSSGNYISKFGSYGPGENQFQLPVSVAIDSYDNIYVADTYSFTIKEFDNSYNYLTKFGTLGVEDGQFGYLQGIFTYLVNNNLYQSDESNSRVQIFGQIDAFSIGPYSLPINGLAPCTTFHYRAFGTNQAGTYYGDDVSFTTTGCGGGGGPTPPGPTTPGPTITPTVPGTTPEATATGAGVIPGTSPTKPSEPATPATRALRSLPRGLVASIPYFLILLLLLLAILYAIQSYREYKSIQRFNMLLNRYRNLEFGSRNFVALTNHYLGTPLGILQFSTELLMSSKVLSQDSAKSALATIKDIKDKVHTLLTESGKATSQTTENINPKLVTNVVNKSSFSPSVWVPMLIAGSLLILTDLLFMYAKVYQFSLTSLAVQVGLFVVCVLLIIFAFRSYARNRFIRKQQSELLKAEQRLMDEKMNFVNKTTNSLKEDIKVLQKTAEELPNNDQTKPFMRGLAMLVGVEKSFELMQQFSTISPFESIGTEETREVINEVLKRHKDQIETKQLSVKQDIAMDMNLGLDKSALIVLLGSTINNAIKFSRQNGNICISTKNDFGGTKIAITDDGVGIDKSKLDQLMEPFSRATDAMKYDYEGIGLGLYLDRIIIEQIGGGIRLSSSPGKGTSIELHIPRGRVIKNPQPLKKVDNTSSSAVFKLKTT